MLNKQTGNMYSWVTHTWNPIKGRCPHGCEYCYMKRFPLGRLKLDLKSFHDNIGEGNTIFIGSSTDMFADCVSDEWLHKVITHCHYFDNTYLFQSKNPKRFVTFNFPDKTILGTTIETNYSGEDYTFSKAPPVYERATVMANLNARKMVSIEPIMDFDVSIMVEWIRNIKPEFVSIGADSKNNKLPEPSPEKITELLTELREFTKVKIKDNLRRLNKDVKK